MSEARSAMLERIRSAWTEPPRESPGEAWARVERGYRRTATASRAELIAQLCERLRDYDAVVQPVTAMELPWALDETLAAVHGRVLIPAGFDRALLPQTHAVVEDKGFTARELDGFAAVLTEATLAIAETGTLVLQGVAGQGRRAATLVPDVHLCVVREHEVVATVPEAIERLGRTATLPTTFVSGPSATADIEMTRIKGVHGPRFLHVMLLREEQRGSVG